jgi:threonine synthase
MSYVRGLRGTASGIEYPLVDGNGRPPNLDPADGRPLEIVLDLERLKREQPEFAWYRPRRPDLWRFGALLALDANDPDDARHLVALGEGCTPLREWPEHPLAKSAGFRLQVKDEGKADADRVRFGANPTQSFKDRGMAMVAGMARRFGLTQLVVPTQGNAGDSLTAYALASPDLSVAVIMPDDTPMPILGNVAAAAKSHPDRVSLDLVKGTIREAGALMREKYLPQGYFNCATFQEPGWRIDGKKTLGLELAEPLPGETKWQLPEVIVYPTGGGTGVLGMWKAWDELQALGVIDARRPRMVCVQAAVTAPIVNAIDTDAEDTTAVAGGSTLATGLNVPGGVGHFKVLEIVRVSGGTAIGVDEASIAHELRFAWRATSWWLCTEAAACLAALPQLLDGGIIEPGNRVVLVNTGSIEKSLGPAVRAIL